MSIISLKSDGDLSWIELDGLTIYIGADDAHVADLCLAVTQDLELLRDTVRKKINSIRWQSDLSRDQRDKKIDLLERAAHKAGVPITQYTAQVTLHGIDLTVGYEMEREDLETGLPPCLTVMSITHCGKDMVEFIEHIGGDDAFEEIANLLGECPEDDE